MMKNRIPLILLLNIAGVALFCSWYLPANHGAWLPVDSAIFHFFNHGVSVSHAYAWLLAIINNRAFDACSLLAMGCLMLSYWLKAPTAGRRQIAIMGAGDAAGGGDHQPARTTPDAGTARQPVAVFSDITRVSDVVNFPAKDASKDSFPGDHGMMLLNLRELYVALFWPSRAGHRADYLCGLCFPRVMVGAHWFSDIAVGSLTAVLIGARLGIDDPAER